MRLLHLVRQHILHVFYFHLILIGLVIPSFVARSIHHCLFNFLEVILPNLAFLNDHLESLFEERNSFDQLIILERQSHAFLLFIAAIFDSLLILLLVELQPSFEFVCLRFMTHILLMQLLNFFHVSFALGFKFVDQRLNLGFVLIDLLLERLLLYLYFFQFGVVAEAGLLFLFQLQLQLIPVSLVPLHQLLVLISQ